MHFPLEPPSATTVEALEKAWRRQDLRRYLVRWEASTMPDIPKAFFQFEKRACDVGCGIGKFIHTQGPLNPDWGYLGIDKGSVRAGKMMRRLHNEPCGNVFALHANAIPVLAAMPAESLDLLTIFYPNPWWPPKHRQKRWAFHPLLPQIATLLKPGGQFIITSNEAFYLSELLYAVQNHPKIRSLVTEYAGPIQVEEGRTHFETKFLNENTPCGELRFVKTALSDAPT